MSSFTRRLLGAALAGALLLTVVSITPAQGHVTSSFTHLWKHIKKKADARYLQKAKAPIPSRTAGVLCQRVRSRSPATTTTHAPDQHHRTRPPGFLVIQARGVYFSSRRPRCFTVGSDRQTAVGLVVRRLSPCRAPRKSPASTGTCPVSTRHPRSRPALHTVRYASAQRRIRAAAIFRRRLDLRVTYVAYGASGAVGTGRRDGHPPQRGDVDEALAQQTRGSLRWLHAGAIA
ncbi:MAG: hypothetical protein V9F00_18215 [Nocardioides sp.]